MEFKLIDDYAKQEKLSVKEVWQLVKDEQLIYKKGNGGAILVRKLSTETKYCPWCKQIKSVDHFGNDANNHNDYLTRQCKVCRRARAKTLPGNYTEERKRKNTSNKSKERRKLYYSDDVNNAAAINMRLINEFGITLDDYNKLFIDQDGKCAICGTSTAGKPKEGLNSLRFAVDHDHATGKVRGLLCSMCNRSLGGFKDDIIILNNAIKYLHKHSKQ
jgi:hypothetical protein